MKQYLTLLREIYHEATPAIYRNGTRFSLFNKTLEFDLRKGFPLITTKPLNWKTAFKETLWFIRGETNTSSLVEEGVINIWDKWQLHEDDVTHKISGDFKVGDIGPMYGHLWRKWPKHPDEGDITIKTIAPDVALKLRRSAHNDKTFEILKENHLKQYIDQLWNLITNLKNDPFTTRHYVTAHHPGYIADPTLSPQENILRGRGCLNPCHRGFQCMVREINGVLHLSLMFEMGSNDVAIGQVGLAI